MNMTQHAVARCQQRGILDAHIRLLTAFGHAERRPGNATAICMSKKGFKELEQDLREGGGVQVMDKLKGQIILLADDDSSVVTCYHRTKKFRD